MRQGHVRWRDCVSTACATLRAFLGRVLGPDHPCRAAVARLIAARVARGEAPCSPQTGPYCKARQRLPVAVPSRLARRVGRAPEDRADPDRRFKGRRVPLADGTTLSMPDTPESQRAFPLPATRKPGLGFPPARLVAVISPATGAARDLAVGPYLGKRTGASALSRGLWDRLSPGDVVVGDRSFCSSAARASSRGRGIDAVFGMHRCRKVDSRRGTRPGGLDHVVNGPKPACPDWMDRATYDGLPDRLAVRELRVKVERAGLRVDELVLATTLPDGVTYAKGEVAGLDFERWDIELDLRSIKAEMRMDVLRCKTPERVEEEVWAHPLAYDAVRSAMADAARGQGQGPRDLSFVGAMQTVRAFDEATRASCPTRRVELARERVRAIASHRVGDRPGRVEPRAIQRRPEPHRLLTVPRREARKLLAHEA